MFEAVCVVLRRLLRPHRLAVVCVLDGGTRVIEVRSKGPFSADIDMTGLDAELRAKGLHPDDYAAALARRIIADALGRDE